MAQKFIALHNVIDGILDSDGINLGQLKEFIEGTEYYEAPVINQIDFTTAEPVAPTDGDRYINTITGVSSATAQAVTAQYIYEWDGLTWVETPIDATLEGAIAYDNNLGAHVVFDGTDWVLLVKTIEYVTDYFVSSDVGNDSNNGLSELEAFATLDAALNAVKIAAVDAAITILDDNTYTFTEDAATPGIRDLGVGLKLIFPKAEIIGQAGGVIFRVHALTLTGNRIDGTNFTFEPQSGVPGDTVRTYNIDRVRSPNFLWVQPKGAGSYTGMDSISVHSMDSAVGFGGVADYDSPRQSLTRFEFKNAALTQTSGSTTYDFLLQGSNSAMDIFGMNYDATNTGAGTHAALNAKLGARIYARFNCWAGADNNGAECDATSNIYIDASLASGGAPMTYLGTTANIVDYSWSQGLNFSKLPSGGTLALTDLVNVRIGNKQEQITLTALQTLIGGGGGGLATKSGIQGSFSGNPKKATVTFSSAFADANYSPVCTTQGVDNYSCTVESIAAGSFVINLNSNVAPSNDVLWTAIKHGES